METPNGTFFENGKAQPTDALANLLAILSADIAKLPNPVLIEGHTDAKPYAAGTYGNWELSADRANMARRLMEDHGVRPEQVVEVRGFADRRLRKPSDPQDSSNRRVTLLVQYSPKSKQETAVEYAGDQPLVGVAAPAPAGKPAKGEGKAAAGEAEKPAQVKSGE
jgi:chemotaxis protein MotB